MKTLLYSGIGSLFIVIAGVLVIPGLMDWNQYKGQIVDRVADELGREFVVSGDISLSVIPKTKFSLNGINIGNIDGASNPRMAHLKSLHVEVSLISLIMGSIEIRRLILVEPELILEKLEDGSTNWALLRQDDSRAMTFIEGINADISFEDVVISNGSLEYIDSSEEIHRRIENVNLRFSAASLAGPFHLNGELTTAGMDLLAESIVVELDGQTDIRARGDIKTSGLVFRFSMESGLEGEGLANWAGEVKVAGDEDLRWPYSQRPWMQVLLGSTNGVSDSVQLSSKFSLKNETLSLTETNFRFGEIKGVGIISVERDGFQGHVDLGHLNLDRMFGSESSTSVGKLNVGALLEIEELVSGLIARPEFRGRVRIAAETVQYKGDAIRDVLITADIQDGAMDLLELSGLFPGGSAVRVEGGLNVAEGSPEFKGIIEGKSDNFQGLLNWLSVDTAVLAGDRLRRLSFSSKLVGTTASGSFTDIDLQFDTSNLRGGVAYAISNSRLGLGVGVRVDQLNIDAYFPKQAGSGDDGTGKALTIGKTGIQVQNIFSAFDADFDIKLDEISLQGIPMTGVILDGLWQQDILDVQEIGVHDLSGASLSFSGLITEIFDEPTVQGSFNFLAEKVGSLVRIIPELQRAPKFMLSSAEIDVAVRGNAEAATIDGVIEAMGSRLALRGTLQDVFLPGEIDIVSDLEIPSVANFVELLSAANVNVPVKFSQFDIPLHSKLQLIGVPSSFNLSVVADALGGNFDASASITNFFDSPTFDVRGQFSHPSVRSFYEVLSTSPHSTFLPLDQSVEVEISLQGTDEKLDWQSIAQLEDLVVNGFGSSEDGHKEAEIRADHPNVVALASIFGFKALRELPIGPLSLSMLLQMEQEGVQIPKLQLNVGNSDIRGRLSINTVGEISRLVGNMESESLDMDGLPLLFLDGLDDRAATVRTEQPAHTGSDSRPNNLAVGEPVMSLWGGLDSKITLQVQKLRALGQTIHDADIDLRVKAGSLVIDALSGWWHDGTLKANGKLEFDRVPDFSMSVELKDADLEKLFEEYMAVNPITGRVDIDAEFYGIGRHIKEIGASFGGSGRIVSVDSGFIKGVNLRQLSDQLDNLDAPGALVDLVSIVLGKGETAYSEFSGTFTADKGVATTQDFSLFLDGAEAKVSGTMDLAVGTQELEFSFYLVDHPSFPPLQLYLKGDVQNPDVNLQAEELYAHIFSTVAETNGVSADLEDIVGQQELDGDEADNLIERLTAPELSEQQADVPSAPAENSNVEDKFGTLLQDLLSD